MKGKNIPPISLFDEISSEEGELTEERQDYVEELDNMRMGVQRYARDRPGNRAPLTERHTSAMTLDPGVSPAEEYFVE